MQAGAYRTTAPVIPPSAAYGLLMNLAGVETRVAGPSVTTLMRADIPPIRLAIGAVRFSTVSTLYQQLHGYPVGESGAELQGRTHGAKYWIAPVRREVLVGLDAMVAMETDDGELARRIERGLAGAVGEARYGLPFAGDNNFLFDNITVSPSPLPAFWYEHVHPGDEPRRGSCRLTVGIDREDASRTTTILVAPTLDASPEPPGGAWVWTPAPPPGAGGG